ncbi:MAG: hypothetical protein ACOCP4_00820 [Candidatus Woesearchaeota archaeon]
MPKGRKKVEADIRVRGRIWGSYKMIPYDAYICIEHYEMLCDDDARLKIIEYVSEKAKRELEYPLLLKKRKNF